MRAKRRVALTLAVIAAITACGSEEPAKKPRKTIVTPSTPEPDWSAAFAAPAAPVDGQIDPPDYRDARSRGPAEGEVPRDERVAALLALVSGGDADHLPLADVEPGRTFDAHLGDSLERRPAGVSVRMAQTTIEAGGGRLPVEVIQRIVRQNFGKFKRCYEKELKVEPKLEGKVTVTFTITGKGEVSDAGDGGSTIGSKDLVMCVVGAMKGITFPEPEGGPVKVKYPMLFSPPD